MPHILFMNDNENPLNHSSREARLCAAECLAAALMQLFPAAILVGGETTDVGFFYDFILEQRLDTQLLQLIEQETLTLIREKHPIKSLSMMRKNAIDFLIHHQLPLRAEALQLAGDNICELIQINQFIDLCPEIPFTDTGAVGTLKLLGQEKTTVLLPESGRIEVTRIKGVVFPDSKLMKKFIKKLEASKKRDHRLLGPEMDLFSCIDELGAGSWCWHPKGEFLKSTLLSLTQDHGPTVSTSPLISPSLDKSLGLAKFFLPSPKIAVEGLNFTLAPDTSVAHALLFRRQPCFIDQLPVRFFEPFLRTNQLKESQLCGMLRSRSYWSAEEQLFCSPQQVHNLLISSLQFINKTIRMFGFETRWHLRSSRSRHAGTEEQWKQATHWLVEALKATEIAVETASRRPLEYPATALYGPRVDVYLVDGVGREWLGPSVGVNLLLPDRLELQYQDHDGKAKAPIMLFRSLFGSLERFVALLVEHYVGNFPLWLAPEQVRVLAVKSSNGVYGRQVADQLLAKGIRATADLRREPIGEKVFAAERSRVPFQLIVGDAEESSQTVTIRRCGSRDDRKCVDIDQLLVQMQQEMTEE